MRIGFVGSTHLAQTLARASELRGFELADFVETADLVLIAQDVEDHEKLEEVEACTRHALSTAREGAPVVLVSQVPPGFTRRFLSDAERSTRWNRPFYYQVDTIIMNCALLRATFPERIIVGCWHMREPLHPHYSNWLKAFGCPIFRMSYESAEMCKLAVNFYLANQVATSNVLAEVAKSVDANWDDMIPAIKADKRMGAYLQPGTIEGSHLVRDVKTITKMIKGHVNASEPAAQPA